MSRMVDHALRQFLQDAISSNLEPRLNVVLGGMRWSGRVTDSSTWLKSVREQGIPSTQDCFRDLDLDTFHLKDCLLLGGAGVPDSVLDLEIGTTVVRFRLDAVQAWWIEPVRVKAKIAVL